MAFQLPSKLKVAGSNPAGVANNINGLCDFNKAKSSQKIAPGS
jgi:hypothetical protein